MILKMYSAYDSKTKSWAAPFYARHPGEAARIIEGICNNPDSQFCKYAGDFQFFEIGDFDDEGGTIMAHETKTALGHGTQYKKPVEISSQTSMQLQ